MVCTFFGHRAINEKIEDEIRDMLVDLIENKNVDLFYVGNQGDFDLIVRKILKNLNAEYSHIKYFVVLAYLTRVGDRTENEETIYPEGMETVPPKYAISKRNRWMIEKSDYVITYVKYKFGGAFQFKSLAERKGRIVFNLAESCA